MNDETQEIEYSSSRSGGGKGQLAAKLHHYWDLLLRKWWVLAIGTVVGLAVAATLIFFEPPSYVSVGRMIVSIKLSIPEGSVYTEEMGSFLGTQTALMQSGVVLNRAHARALAQCPGLQLKELPKLNVTVSPRTSIFVLQATGEYPQYVQVFLQGCMEEYTNLKKEMRAQTSDTTVAGLTEEVLRLQKELAKNDQELAHFQSSNSVVLLQEQGNSAGSYLATLNQRLATLKSEYELLRSLTLDQNLERRQQLSASLPLSGGDPTEAASTTGSNESDYMKAKQQILLMKAEQQEMGQYLRPKHPRMIAMSEEIARRERLLDIFRKQSAEQLENRKSSLALQIQTLEKDVKEWDAKNLEISRKSAEYQRLKANSQRTQALYDRLLATMQTLDVNKEVSPESVTIMEPASQAMADTPKHTKKLMMAMLLCVGLSIGLLLFLDHLDDRLNSFTELQEVFNEPVLVQIPREKAKGKHGQVPLIEKDDERHSFLESYRNLRSSLLYMSEEGKKPRTLLLTSSIPNEGKSMTSANLAITLASTNAKVLLVDADLRRGVLHRRFGVESGKGLCEVLTEGLNWEQAVVATRCPNLSLLPRGGTSNESSELFIGEDIRKLLQAAAARYDYVILDTAPVMAADDVTSLAPHVDTVLFVLRAEHTSARVAQAALDLLYQRNVRVMGIVFNAVRPKSADYYYYYKYKDYYASYPSGNGKGKRRKGEEVES